MTAQIDATPAPVVPPADRGATSWWRRIPVAEVAFGLTLVATIACYIVKSSGLVFAADDWNLVQRGKTPGDFFEPYNNHLSIVPIAVYRLQLALFGLRTYLPLRLVGLGSMAMVAVAIFLLLRSRIGAAPALVVGVALLWYPELELAPQAFGFYLALVATVFCAWALGRDGPRADAAIGLALGFAFCTSGVGVALAVGCLVHVAVAGASRHRWLAVTAPTLAWAMWWLLAGRGSGPALPRTFTGNVEFVLTGLGRSFDGLAFGNRLLGFVLAAGFVANLVRQLRRGPRAAPSSLAWTAALLFWWVGLAYSRGVLASPDAYRYRLVGSVFVLLACVPTASRPGDPGRAENRRQAGVPALGAALLVAALIVFVNHDGIFRHNAAGAVRSSGYRETMILANLGPGVLPDDTLLRLGGYVPLPAGTYRQLVADHGAPPGTEPAHVDATLVAIAGIRPIVGRGPLEGRCTPLAQPVNIGPDSEAVLQGADGDVEVRVRRFGSEWVTIGRLSAGTTATVRFPPSLAVTPWAMVADGACLLTQIAEVPSVVGLNAYEAAGIVQAAGLRSDVVQEPSDTVPNGTVIAQSPEGGTELSTGSHVQLVVSTGPS